jgi:hypothetical protein
LVNRLAGKKQAGELAACESHATIFGQLENATSLASIRLRYEAAKEYVLGKEPVSDENEKSLIFAFSEYLAWLVLMIP